MYIKLPGADVVLLTEGNIIGCDTASATWTRRGLRPWHVNTISTREPGDLPSDHLPVSETARTGKSTAGHQRYLCSHCRKTWQLQFTYTASQPGTHQKIIDMAMNGVGCRATARIMGVGLNTILRHLKNSDRSR